MDHQTPSAAIPADDSLQLDDFALADSFINFDYEPDDESDPTQLASVSDPLANSPIEEKIEQISLVDNDQELEEGEIIAVADVGVDVDAVVDDVADDDAVVDDVADDDADGNVRSESPESESAADTSSSSSTNSSDSYELEEGEILDSDVSAAATDDEDDEERRDVGVDGDDRTEARSENDHQILPMVPRMSMTLGPHHQMYSVGVVKSILGAKVIVEGMANHEPLNEGSILWITQKRRPLGFIDEIFGQVKSPYYVVRYNSESEIPEGICRGASISFVPEFANHVLNNEDLYNKGYDVSSLDEEEDEIEFSDDEKEAEYMRRQRGKSRKEVPPNGGSSSSSTLPGHGHCSPIYGTGQRLAGATNVNPPFPPVNASPNFTSSGVWRNETTLPHSPAMPLPGHGHFSPFYGTGQNLVGATNVNPPPFLHASVGPNFTSSGVWRNETTLLHASAMPLHANGHYSHAGSNFTLGGVWTNGVPGIPHQLLVPGIQFQQQLNPAQGFPPFQPQLNPGHGFPPATVFTGAPQPQFQPPIQFNPGSSAGRGRGNGRGRTFHHGGRKGWRPPM